jgi:hypothetical protein
MKVRNITQTRNKEHKWAIKDEHFEIYFLTFINSNNNHQVLKKIACAIEQLLLSTAGLNNGITLYATVKRDTFTYFQVFLSQNDAVYKLYISSSSVDRTKHNCKSSALQETFMSYQRTKKYRNRFTIHFEGRFKNKKP